MLFFTLGGTNVGAGEPKLLTKELLDEGWISLFDGETTFGWQPVGEAKWEIVDGEIRTTGERPGFLMTTTRWGNFFLDLEFKAAAKTNSGIFLRTPLEPHDPAEDCYELNVAPPDNPFPTGSFVARMKAVAAEELVKPDEWHKLHIAAAGGLFRVSVDGKQVLEYTDEKPTRIGHIGLQLRDGPIAFRNLRLKPGIGPIFNGNDLNGWVLDRAEKCQFEVTKEGELHVTNGPGQIESYPTFRNFVVQVDCKVNGDGLNSGIFFRTLREGRWAGYESQINNRFKDGDRNKPADFGTGGIYRRQPARRVIPNDREWFTKTVVADGPHMAVWVNGFQVSDWSDPRGERENAREGKKLGPGAIAIQGHDPTTDFLFRNIRAAELPR